MQSKLIELGRRFSDDTYASKEEVKAIYNLDQIDDIWENILTYREFYHAETELRDSSSLPYKICLTKKLSGQSYSLQSRLSSSLVRFIVLPSSLQKEYFSEKEFLALKHTALATTPSVSDNILRKLANDEIESVPSHLFSLKAYHDAYIQASKLASLSLSDIEKLNNIIIGEEENAEVKYRNKTSEDVINPLIQVVPSEIKLHLERLFQFLKNETVPAILRALSILYVFSYLRPFEYCNEETAALASKAFMSCSGFGYIGFSLNFESIAYSNAQSFFRRLKLTESTLDLTYILDRFLAFIIQDENESSALLKELSIRKVELNDVSSLPSVSVNEKDESTPMVDTTSLALPTFQNASSDETVEAIARKLREVHPQLKKKQAHFYAGHCTIGLHYTIEQFKELEHTVYETARTSMEDLANRGFYKKELVGKKFVYTPVPLDE